VKPQLPDRDPGQEHPHVANRFRIRR
jgi:hypothetical protein